MAMRAECPHIFQHVTAAATAPDDVGHVEDVPCHALATLYASLIIAIEASHPQFREVFTFAANDA
jgi:hypothetical protein